MQTQRDTIRQPTYGTSFGLTRGNASWSTDTQWSPRWRGESRRPRATQPRKSVWNKTTRCRCFAINVHREENEEMRKRKRNENEKKRKEKKRKEKKTTERKWRNENKHTTSPHHLPPCPRKKNEKMKMNSTHMSEGKMHKLLTRVDGETKCRSRRP